MKKFLLIISIALALVASVNSTEIVATINNKPITKEMLDREINRLLPKTFYHSTITDEKLKSVTKEALDELIKRELLYQYSQKIGIKVTKKELKEHENKIIKSFSSKKEFKEALKNINLTEKEFKEALKKDIALEKLYQQEIKVTYSEDDLKEYYEKNRYKFKAPEKIRVRQIFIKVDPTKKDSKEKSKKLIQEIQKKLKKGESFADLAYKYSDDMSRIKGGDMGFVHKGRIDSRIEKIAFELDINETSDIIELDVGYYLVKVEGKKPSIQLKFEDVKKSLKQELIQKNENRKKESLLNKLKKEADIKINKNYND